MPDVVPAAYRKLVPDGWRRAPAHLRDFNGLTLHRWLSDRCLDVGIFREKYGGGWRVRFRPTNQEGKALNGWNVGVGFETRADALAWFDRTYPTHATAISQEGETCP